MATNIFHCFTLLLLLLSLNPHLAFSESCHPNDKKALLKIKKELNNPNYLISWDPKTDCCTNWTVVKCDDTTPDHRVTELDFDPPVDLSLPIPPSIGDLPYLEFLHILGANLIGHIPQSISKLSNLQYLFLSWNDLTGPVPSFLAKLKNLRIIDLSINSLTGPIPASLSQLPNLRDLSLEQNKLTGEIPESFADFKIPDDNFHLELSRNRLTGWVPARLGSVNFIWIGLSGNRLEGDVSFLFGKNKSLVWADLSWNAFDFDMSKVEFPKSLTHLDLSHNRIRGRLPGGLVELDRVELNVSYNRLCGPIPVGGKLQEMGEWAYLHNKCLCGAPLPKCN